MEAAESGREWKAGRDGRASREVREDELLFCVDRWSCNKNNYKLFFLTHLHSDHTKGLSESWQKGPIYCSSITYDLILLKFPAFDRSLIHSLPVGIPSLISIPTHDHLLEVTAIDADHCPGMICLLLLLTFFHPASIYLFLSVISASLSLSRTLNLHFCHFVLLYCISSNFSSFGNCLFCCMSG